MSMVHPTNAVVYDRADVMLHELEQLPTGPLLLAGLARLSAVSLGAYGAVRASVLWARMTAHCQAQQMIATYEGFAGADRHLLACGHGAVEIVGEELAALTHLSSGASIAAVELTQYAGDYLAEAWQALDRGQVTLDHVKRLARATEHAPSWVTRAVDAQLIPLALTRGWTPSRLAAEATKAVIALDPDGSAERAKKAKAAADVTVYPGTDETATLIASGDAATLRQVMDAIQARATELARDAADPLPAGLARFHALADLVLGHDQATKPQVETLLTIDLTTWLGLTRTPGELAGYGPITGETARELSADSGFRLMITDPVTGAALALGRTRYRPSAALNRFIQSRDLRCQFPGCHQRATKCDIDHILEDRLGGPTDPANLHCLCRRHHNLKTHQLWHLSLSPSGEATWTSAYGFAHRRRRATYSLDPLEPPDDIDQPPEDIDNAIPTSDPNPPPGPDDPLPETPTLTLEEYLTYSDDLERSCFLAANARYDDFYRRENLAS